MPRRYRLRLTPNQGGPAEDVEGEIPDDDWAVIARFGEYASQLREAEWARGGLDADFRLTWNQGEGSRVHADNAPANSVIREALHLARPFLLVNEPTHFNHVHNLLSRNMPHPALRRQLAHYRDGFLGKRARALVTLSVGRPRDPLDPNDPDWMVINDEHTFSLWLNAFEYHRDEEKRAELTRYSGGQPDELMLAVFRQLFALKLIAVLQLDALIALLRDDPERHA